MARDRQRAKQRRRRQTGAPTRTTRSQQAREIGLDDTDIEESGLGGSTPVPDPLDHASADVDEALLAETGADAREGGVRAPDIVEEEREVERVQHEAEGRRGGIGRVFGFLAASWAELQRVQWPDRRHVGQGTAVVLGFVVIAGAYLGLLDAVINPIIQKIL
jgi:preprotein translocase SecE subunit